MPYSLPIRCSLHQKDAKGQRTLMETQFFAEALAHMHRFFAHKCTIVFLLTALPNEQSDRQHHAASNHAAEYNRRGWVRLQPTTAHPSMPHSPLLITSQRTHVPRQCFILLVGCHLRISQCMAESTVAKLTKALHLVLDLGQLHSRSMDAASPLPLARLQRMCTGGQRQVPIPPDAFNKELHNCSFANEREDRPLVEYMYHSAFHEMFQQGEELHYERLGWTSVDARVFADVMRTTSTEGLRRLFLDGNQIGDDGVGAIADAVHEIRAGGGMARLEVISMRSCGDFSASSCDALRNAAQGVTIWLDYRHTVHQGCSVDE